MIDIKLRNVKVEDAHNAVGVIKLFLDEYPDRKGFHQGAVYSSPIHKPSFYVYRTPKTIVCVAYYLEDGALVDK